MCGIAGEVRFGGGVTAPPVEALSRGIRHRGPDDDGLWLDRDRRCGLAFRRLSILDLSPLGHQPMIDPETGNVIVFNGEVYNFQALRRECENAGAKFRSQSDTEVVLALWRRLGPDCVRRLRGMFAMAIWDARKGELFLARDRFGKKPLNYALTKDGLVFCSEIGPLSRHPAVPQEEDAEALEFYLQLSYVPAPWTIYRSIRKLPPAHWAIFSEAGLRLERYWDLDYSRKLRIGEREALEAFEEKFNDAVRLRMIADVPLGALLSGGVDSGAVVAAMSKFSGAPVKTFSVGFDDDNLNELPFANEAARICGTDHHPLVVTSDVAATLPVMAAHYGEPYADPSAIPSFRISEVARQHVTVALNGDGGDELLGGYPRYRLSRASLLSSRLLGPFVPADKLIGFAANDLLGTGAFTRAAALVARKALHPDLGSFLNARDNWNDRARRELIRGNGAPDLLAGWRRAWLKQAGERAKNPFDRMLYLDNHTQLPGDLLPKMDIASMHCSLEARSPLLDHELAEFCAGLPLELKVRKRGGKYLLKRLAAKTFGNEYVNRRKQGFGIPLETWLRGTLLPHVREVLGDRDLMGPFAQPVIARTLGEFLSDRENSRHVSRLWALFMYGMWRESVRATAMPMREARPALVVSC